MKTNKTKALKALEAARKNGGRLSQRVAGCADAVRLGWMNRTTYVGKLSIGSRSSGLCRYERLYGWIEQEWTVTAAAPAEDTRECERT